MSSPASRKAKPRGPPSAENAVALLRELIAQQSDINAQLAAIRQHLESDNAASPAADPSVDAALAVIKADALTLQQAAGRIDRDEKTIRRWCEDFGIGFELGGKPYVFESKLLVHVNNITRVQKRSAD